MILKAALFCLAMTVYHEARSESTQGQEMVAAVVLNRADWKPEEVCSTVRAERQFSYLNGTYILSPSLTPKNPKAWEKAKRVAARVLNRGRAHDPSKGATFYHTLAVSPAWRLRFVKVATVGAHVFYRTGPVSQG